MRNHKHIFGVPILLRGLVPLLVTGCGTGPSDCDPCRTTAVVMVAAQHPDGTGVPGVLVTAETYTDTCGTQPRGFEGNQATNVNGERRILVSSLFGPHVIRCVRITVSDPEPPNLTLAEQDFLVELEFRTHADTPRDSVRLEVVVP